MSINAFLCIVFSVGIYLFFFKALYALSRAEPKCGLLVLPDPGGSPLLSFSLLVALKGSNWLAGSAQNGSELVNCAGTSYLEFFLLPLYSLLFLPAEKLGVLFAVPKHRSSSFLRSPRHLACFWHDFSRTDCAAVLVCDY